MDEIQQYYKDLLEWKERNGLPADAEEPGAETPKRPDEDMMDYVMRIAKHRIEKEKWQEAPRLENYTTLDNCIIKLKNMHKANKRKNLLIVCFAALLLVLCGIIVYLVCFKETNKINSLYSEETTNDSIVYICTSETAKKYHKYADCRWLEKCSAKIKEISIEKAEKQRKTPCKSCYKKK